MPYRPAEARTKLAFLVNSILQRQTTTRRITVEALFLLALAVFLGAPVSMAARAGRSKQPMWQKRYEHNQAKLAVKKLVAVVGVEPTTPRI
jgi:hypothetical protein